MEKVLTIEPDGTLLTLYADDLPNLGGIAIARASNVEPEADGNGWSVILTNHPANGQYAGREIARHVPRRDEALRLEVAFIQENILV